MVDEKAGNKIGVKMAAMTFRRKFWIKKLAGTYPALAFVANRLLRMHASTCASERNWSLWGNLFTKARNRLGLERAEKLIYIRQNSKATPTPLCDEAVLMDLLSEE